MRPALKTTLRSAVPLGLFTALALLAVAEAEAARPGGGHSYSGGSHSHHSSHSFGSSHSYRSSSSGSSHSSGGTGTPVDRKTAIVVTTLIGFISVASMFGAVTSLKERGQSFDTAREPRPRPRTHGALADLRARDPDFSAVLFEDFVYALYARAQAARGDPEAMAALTAYVSDEARAALLRRDPSGVKIHGVVIGKMQVVRVIVAADVRVEVVFEANYTAELPGGPQGYYVEERWVLERALDVTSKPPTDVYSFHCPSCGGPYERSDEGRCKRCAQQVEGGRFDWWLRAIEVSSQEPRGPALTGDVEEQGTDLPSVLEPDIAARHAAFAAKDASASADALEHRVREIYAALNPAWTACDLRPIRPHVSDALYNYLSYWVDAYRAQGLRNVLEDMQVSRVQIVKLTRDHHYDAITVRLWARGLDYTVSAADPRRCVSGSPRHPRAYSEYWTLIRSARVHGATRAAGSCPNCGASLERVNMAGNCEACGAHITRGEFDWVLGKIEQDDAYTG